MSDNAAITLGLPSKYLPKAASIAPEPSTAPSIEWLSRTWTVTHSTLSMWRKAQNVRITYKPLPAKNGKPRIDDIVEYEPTKKNGRVRKTVKGVDTQAATPTSGIGAWDWRGKGLLGFVTSHWEVLGWGEAITPDGETERWAVTWFAPTIFTKEGVDVYCDRREGISPETYARIESALRVLDAQRLVIMVADDMQSVKIGLPWNEE